MSLRVLPLLLVALLHCGGTPDPRSPLLAKDAPRLLAWMIELGGPHGEAVWIDEAGHVLVQDVVRADGKTTSNIHRFTLEPEQMAQLRALLAGFRPSSLEAEPRQSSADAEEVNFGFRDPTGHLQKRRVVGIDWERQRRDLRRFHELLRAARQSSNRDNVVSSEEVRDEELRPARPDGLLPGESIP